MGSIPLPALNVRPAEQKDPLASIGQVLSLKSLLQQQQLGSQQLQAGQNELNEQEAVKRAIAASGGDVRKALPEILKSAPKLGISLQKQLLEWDNADITKKKSITDLNQKKAERMGQLAGTIKDDASYKAAIQQGFQEQLLDEEDAKKLYAMPYDPAMVQNFVQSSLTTQQQLEEARKKLAAEAEQPGKKAKSSQEQLQLISQWMAGATNAAGWKARRASLAQRQDVPADMVALVPEEYSAENASAVKQMGVTPMQRQPVPGTDIPYSPEVEEQQKRINASRAQTAGLSPQQFSKVTNLASQFDANPVVKRYNEQVNRAEGVKQILLQESGPRDMAIVFEFMKALDPESVVRESEYATAAKSGNIFAGAMARFNGYFKAEGGKLPENVKREFAKILDSKLAISRRQVNQMHGDFSRRINKITGRDDGAEYLTDYSSIYGSAGGADSGVQGGTVQVIGPDGKNYSFPNQTAADAFKKAAGIK